jgi:hypothetical protein
MARRTGPPQQRPSATKNASDKLARSGVRWTIVGCVIGALATAIAFIQYVHPTAAPTAQPPTTTVITFSAFGVPASVPSFHGLGDAVCASTSSVSLRSDARACVSETVFYDPCFLDTASVVLCPNPGQEPGGAVDAFRVVKTVRGGGPPFNHQTVSIDQAVAQTYPWAIRPVGSSQWCLLAGLAAQSQVLASLGTHVYVCGNPFTDVITNNEVSWLENPKRQALEFEWTSRIKLIRELTPGSGGSPWTGQMLASVDKTSVPINIAEVEF